MAGSRRLDINLHLDRTDAERSEAAARAKMKQTAEGMISDADAAERAKLEFVKRANAQKVAELAKANKTEIELAKEAAAASAKAHKDAAAAREKADKEAAAAQTRAEKEAAAESAKIAREAEAEAKRLDAERVASAKRVAREQMQAQVAACKRALQLLEEEDRATERLNHSQMSTVNGFVQMGAAMVGLQSAASVFHAIVDDLDKAEAYSQKTAEEILRIRGAVRELAALRGDMGSTGATTAHVASMTAQTLQTPEEAIKTEQAFRGVAELAIGTGIAATDVDAANVSAGKFATMEGGSPNAFGGLYGQIALQSKEKLSPKEIEARANRLYNIQRPGAFETGTQAIEQFKKLNGFVMNGILTPEQAMGFASMYSLKDAGTAATSVEQMIQATIPAQFKARNISIDPDMDHEKTYEYLHSIGVHNETDPQVVLEKIAADIKAQEAKKIAGFTAIGYLAQKGYGNQTQAQAVLDFAGLKNTDKAAPILKAMIAPLEYGAHGGGVITEQFEEKLRHDPDLQNRQALRLGEIAKLKRGLAAEPYELARKSAFGAMSAAGEIDKEYSDWTPQSDFAETREDIWHWRNRTTNSFGGITDKTRARLYQEARRIGIAPNPGGGLPSRENDKELARRIQLAGGDVTGNAGQQLQQAVANFEKSVARFEKAIAPKGAPPAPIRGKPNQPQMRP